MAFLFAPHVPRLRALGLHPAIPQMSSLGEGQSNIERRGGEAKKRFWTDRAERISNGGEKRVWLELYGKF